MIEIISHSENETLAQASAFAATLKPGDAVAFEGPLGAGKTLFCRGVVQALGYSGHVASPTYALVHEYPGRIPIYHMDLYRLASAASGAKDVDWEEIGWEHYFNGEGICLIEWPDRLPLNRRRFTYRVELEVIGETERKIRIVSL